MKKKLNKYNFSNFENIKKQIENVFPGKFKKAFYISDFKNSNIIKDSKLEFLAISGVCEINGGNVDIRIYRESGEQKPKYDVDEIRCINKQVKIIPNKKEIENHHMNCKISEDIIKRNQLTIEMIEDKKGNLKPNIQKDGTFKTLASFK